MAEENNEVVEDKKIVETPEAKPDTGAVPPEPQFDVAAFEELKDQMAQLTQKAETSEKANQKLEEIGKILSGKEGESFNREKFLNDLAIDPEGTLGDFISKSTANQTKELKNQLRQFKLKEEDSLALQRLKTEDPDYDFVMANIGKAIPEFKELYNSLEDNPERNDIIYYKAKARLARMGQITKETQETKNREAKETINRTAKSEVPSGGTVETKTMEDERRERIGKARENFDTDKVIDEVLDGDWEFLMRERLKKTQ